MVSEFVVLPRSIDKRNTDKQGFGQKELMRQLQLDYQMEEAWPQGSMSNVKMLRILFGRFEIF